MEYIEIFGVKIHNITFQEAVEEIKSFLQGDSLRVIYTPNPEIVMGAKDNENLRDLLNKGDLVTPDGIGLIYASRIKKKPIKERVTGYDLSLKMLEIANDNGFGLYLLGGKEGVAEKAAQNIKKDYPNIRIAGYHHGYFKGSHNGNQGHEEEKKIIDEINSTNPDIIFVGLGFPKQEIWIDTNRNKIKGKVIIGNGGVMDILSGNVKAAPNIIRKMGFEWLYRLIRQPSRIKRQIALPKFMLHVIFSKDAVK
ncbi:MAG TPA: WecB/TagA/CpsF family glycosyltransferase [Tissierellaceae bacterium]